jgi:type IV pilus assembly protein PilW
MNLRHGARGFSLVELMIAMVLGLVIIGGVISVMLANKRSYRSNQGMSQIQESARTAYELLARDIRQTGGTGCDNARRMSNAFATGAEWWKTWFTVRGYDGGQTDPAVTTGSGADLRVAGTDSLHLHSVDGGGFPVELHNATAGTILINNAATTSFATDEQLLICDFDHAATFRATTYDGATSTLRYSLTGNCSTGLGFPTTCDGGAGNVYTFPRNSWVGRLAAVDWYIGNNNRPEDGGRSLYRERLSPAGVVVVEEMVSGVTDMQIRYGITASDTIVDSTTLVTAADWATVNSVFITLTISTSDINVSSDMTANSGRIQRTFTYVITLRNRVA